MWFWLSILPESVLAIIFVCSLICCLYLCRVISRDLMSYLVL
ncbi:hypothetical protein Hanom_Chr03g00276551 [Helianthus anomalus]